MPLGAVALGLAASLLYAALHDVSQAYDVWYYHLPFAARLGGLMDASTYAFSTDNVARYEGFPLLAELVQGILWRVTSHVQSTNLVALGALFGLCVFLWRLFKVPPHLALIAFVAIPLVQMHATSSYVDLPANACATMLLLLVYRELSSSSPLPESSSWLIACVALAAITANSKFQLVPIVLVTAIVIVVLVVRDARQHPRAGLLRTRLAILALGVPIVFTTPIENLAVHHNPVWPVELSVMGHAFPYVEGAYSHSPPHLANSPRPVRFAHSIFEVDNRPIESHARWSFDQWAPPSDPSCRMGGYFGAYVLANLLALGLAAIRKTRTRGAIVAALFFTGVTIVASLVPQSHELRYYMHWMLLLVSLNLVSWTGAPLSPSPSSSRTRREIAIGIAGVIAALALAVVGWSTEGSFLYASGSTFPEYLAKRVDRAVLDGVAPGERICVARQPFTFLYAPSFHREKRYAVQEATGPADCKGARSVDP